MPPLQVAAHEAVSVETEARLQSQARLHDEAVKQLQQQRQNEKKAHKEKLQQKVDELTRWRGEVRRLNNVVLTNNVKSGKFYEVRRT